MFFVFNDTATTEIYTLSLHDALPIWVRAARTRADARAAGDPRRAPRLEHPRPRRGRLPDGPQGELPREGDRDRKSTRLNSSHAHISYAVFCLKKKNTTR